MISFKRLSRPVCIITNALAVIICLLTAVFALWTIFKYEWTYVISAEPLVYLIVFMPFVLLMNFRAEGDVPMWKCFSYTLPSVCTMASLVYEHRFLFFLCFGCTIFALLFAADKLCKYKPGRVVKNVLLVCFWLLIVYFIAKAAFIYLYYLSDVYGGNNFAVDTLIDVFEGLGFERKINEAAYTMLFNFIFMVILMPVGICLDFKANRKAVLWRGIAYIAAYADITCMAVLLISGA